jgi:NTE family protein
VTRCICIFEGGGAKGIAHIGALRAFEDARFQLVGFAGTSAGAIVAALAAAGYTSRDLYSETGSILDLIDEDSSNVWSGRAFHPLRAPPRLLGRIGWTSMRVFAFLSHSFGWLVSSVLLIASGVPFWVGWIGAGTMIALQAVLVSLLLAIPFLLIYPAASLSRMAAAINQALSLKVRRNRRPDPVTFSDLRAAGCPPLKIVATDIASQSLVMFSADTTPDVAVGDAVAASACIPGVFRAHRIGERLCYDGGLVSNLPAWTFDPERAIDRDSWTAVVEIGEAAQVDRSSFRQRALSALLTLCFGRLRPRGLGILSATISTAVFGAGVLNTRSVDRLRSQPLGVDLGLLEFGVTRTKADAIIAAACRESRANVVFQIDELPRLIEDMCERLARQVLGLINIARTSESLPRYDGRLRIALFFPPRDDPHSLVSEFNYGFHDDPDERLRVPVASSLIGKVWEEQAPYYIDDTDKAEWESYLSRPEDRWVRKQRWSAMSWLIAIPYYHIAGDQNLVVAIDADRPLGVTQLQPLLSSILNQVETMLNLTLPMEAFAWLK